MTRLPVWFRALVFAAGAVLSLAARAAEMEFHLPAQPAANALIEFSRQARIDVLFSYDQLERVRSAEVDGWHEPEAAIELLLQGTGFAARRNAGDGGFVVSALKPTPPAAGRVRTNPKSGPTASGPVQLGAVVVKGANERLDVQNPNWPQAPLPSPAGNLDLPRTEDDPLAYTIFTSDQISRSGLVNLDEFLQRELLDAAPETPDPGGAVQNLVSGNTNLNLRGYGADETIILVNGRRLPPVVTVGDDPLDQTPDVSLIPTDLVEKIEVLPVSASALYGGNPVGGVINIILNSDADVNRTELTGTYTNALRRFSAPESTVSVLNVQSLLNGAVHLRLNASFTDTVPPTEAQLGYHQAHEAPPPPLGQGVLGTTPNVTSNTPSGTNLYSPLFGQGTPFVTSVAPGSDGTGGITPFLSREGVRSVGLYSTPGDQPATNPGSLDYTFGEPERRAFYYLSADYEPSRLIRVGFDGTYAKTVINPGYTVLSGDLALPAGSPFNPFQQNVLVSLYDTTPALGAGYNQAQIQYASGILAIELQPVSNWQLSLDAQYAETLSKYRGVAGVDSMRWQELVDDGEYNPLRDTQVTGPPPAFYDQAVVYEGGPGGFATLGNYHALDTTARLSNPALVLPTGTALLNVGGDYERDRFGNLTDPFTYGDGGADGTTTWTGRTLQQESAFAEMEAPLLEKAWLPSWMKRAEIDAGVRYDASAYADEASVAPTVGVKLQFAGGFSLRGGIATSNRFPTQELSQQQGVAVSSGIGSPGTETVLIFDPLRDQSYDVSASNQLNPILEPESTVTRSVGGLFESGRTRRFRGSVDLADTVKRNEVVDLDPQTVMDLEGLLPGRVERAPLAAGDSHNAGYVTSLTTGAANLYRRHSDDLTAALDYSWEGFAGGTLDLYSRAVYFLSYQRQVLTDSPVVDELHYPDGSAPDLLRMRDNFGADWTGRRYGLGFEGEYFAPRVLPVEEWPSQASDQIGRYWQFDGYLQADLSPWIPWKNPRYGLKAQLRVNNVFGWTYPFYANQSSGAGVAAYGDWRGRTYSLSLTATF